MKSDRPWPVYYRYRPYRHYRDRLFACGLWLGAVIAGIGIGMALACALGL